MYIKSVEWFPGVNAISDNTSRIPRQGNANEKQYWGVEGMCRNDKRQLGSCEVQTGCRVCLSILRPEKIIVLLRICYSGIEAFSKSD